MLKIEDKYWEGKQCLENEVPWLVPKACYTLDTLLNKNDYVIELGTGGSTLFYAKRCGFVQAVETDKKWGSKVFGRCVTQNYRNLRYVVLEEVQQIKSYFDLDEKLKGLQVTVLSVDTIQGYDRSDLMEHLLCKYLHSLRIIVMDNYAEKSLWPKHWHLLTVEMLEMLGYGWRCEPHNDDMWYGQGTKLFIRDEK